MQISVTQNETLHPVLLNIDVWRRLYVSQCPAHSLTPGNPSSLSLLGFLSMASGDFLDPLFCWGHLTASDKHSAFSPQLRHMHFTHSKSVPTFSKQGSVNRWLRHKTPFSPDFHSGTCTRSPLPIPDAWHRTYP